MEAPRSGHCHKLDHVMVSQRDNTDCTYTKAMRDARPAQDQFSTVDQTSSQEARECYQEAEHVLTERPDF